MAWKHMAEIERPRVARIWPWASAIAPFLIIGMSVAGASAADRTRAVQFKRGTAFATLSGSIKGYDTLTYTLGAKSGQAASILFAPSNGSCYMNVFAPGSDEASLNGSMTGSNEFSGNLTASGQYRIQVYLMRNAARRNETCRHKITFEVR